MAIYRIHELQSQKTNLIIKYFEHQTIPIGFKSLWVAIHIKTTKNFKIIELKPKRGVSSACEYPYKSKPT
jgi:hypothetical protein